MPSFDTPAPITVTLDLGVAYVRIATSDRPETVVEVRPSDETDESDVQAARQIQVEYADGTLRVTGPKRKYDFSRKSRSSDVSIELPAGSLVTADVLMGDIRGAGELGQSRFKTGAGNLWVERTGAVHLRTGAGHVTAESIGGDAEISTGTGKIQVGEIAGTAAVKSSNGDIVIDAVGGDARVRTANGEIRIERAGSGVDAKSSNGAIRLGEVVRGAVVLGSAMGDLDIGIAQGTAAWLEVNTGFGHVRNHLDNATGPEEAAATVEIRGHTSYGDITIHHA